jgi:tetratricopeptide (TPR) repeat protein
MTLNYDLEIEWTLLTTEAEKRAAASSGGRHKFFAKLLGSDGVLRSDRPSADCLETRLQRYLIGRGQIISDVLDRDRSEVLTEFALETPWKDTRILHLHGRADVPESLVVTKRDYRDRYWEAGFSKLPFEYGMRLIFSGNPVLLVGVGGSEPDVMRTLEQLLSDNPNRRAVPAFLLWNSPKSPSDEVLAEVQRLELYRRYGIHLLFDYDIAEVAGIADYRKRIEKPLPPVILRSGTRRTLPDLKVEDAIDARRLDEPIKLLGDVAKNALEGEVWPVEELRSPEAKLAGDPQHVKMWAQVGGPQAIFSWPDRAAELLAAGNPIKAILAEPGSGRGTLAKAIEKILANSRDDRPFAKRNRVVLINGSFAIETDSIFGILSGATDGSTAQKEEISRVKALMNGLALMSFDPRKLAQTVTTALDPAKALAQHFGKGRRVTIIVNGMERFIGHDGSALSNELDTLIRLLIGFYDAKRGFAKRWDELADAVFPNLPNPRFDYPVNLILLGTDRVRRYLSALSTDIDYYTILEPKSATGKRRLAPEHDAPDTTSTDLEFNAPGSYFPAVSRAFGTGLRLASPGTERSPARRAFLAQVLKEEALEAVGSAKGKRRVKEPLLCLEVVRTLAFVGQPLERDVLRHVPGLWELTEKRPAVLQNAVADALLDLKRLKLILPLKPFVAGGMKRFGLHKSVIAEMRERFGVPLSDARLSGGFNLSLTAAQAIDSAAPELAWHDDLGQLVDFLTGAFSDPRPTKPDTNIAKILKSHRDDLPAELRWYSDPDLIAMASEEFSACLRAALAIMRSYYSVPALLMQANRDLDPWMRDGPLSEHAERLDRLLRMGRNAAALRALVRQGTPDKSVRKWLGPNAFYPDDLVWLYNELGVVRATQGSLFEAEQAFREAQKINDSWVECGDRQQNWRRIQLNLAQVGIDRGDIEGTEERLRDLEATVVAQAAAFGEPPGDHHHTAWEYIIRRYGRDPRSPGEEAQLLPVRVDPNYPTDLILAVALIQGFRGQCMHLRGGLDAAKACLSDALSILLRLNELRAYAYFQRQAAALHAAFDDKQAARQALKLCIAAAGPSRQTDIDHSGRVALVQYDLVESVATRPPWIMQLTESLRYATAGDMFRLQLECMQALAQVHLRHGDTDSALRYANDAMAIAARCGFDLRAVSLRILVARILSFRGDTTSARALLETAEHIATKMKYERAVEAAENELIRLG